jgi:nucleoside 2-deoxyribosyltransferase
MKDALAEIDKSDLLLAEAETMALGVGLEAGYAHGRDKKVGYLYKTGSQKQQTLSGIVDYFIEYETAKDVISWFETNYFSK